MLCLWFPNWPIQRLVVSEPELRRQRVVLFRRDARRGQVVSAVSPLAMQDGACVDMPLSEAKSLLRRGGEFHIFEHDLNADVEAIEVLADSLESFSPIVGLETVAPQEFKRGRRPDSLLLEVTGLAHLFGDENQLARQLLIHGDALGYLPRIAIADTVGVAWAMARYFAGQYFAQSQQPVVLAAGDQDSFKQLPVESLRLPATVTDTLYQLGVETVGQLQKLSRSDLAMRFGNEIHRRLDQLTGSLEEPVIARRKPAEFITEQLLEYPTSHRETIEVILSRLVGRLCERLRSRQRGALEWTIRLVCQSGPPLEFRVNLFQPTAQTKQVMPLLEMQLEQALSPHTRKSRKKNGAANAARKRRLSQAVPKDSSIPRSQASLGRPAEAATGNSLPKMESQFCRYTTIQIQEIEVSVTSNVLLSQQQRQLFDENPRLDRQSLAHLINRLANRLGPANVVYPSLLAGAQPEYSFRLKPLVDPQRKHRRRKTKSSKQSHVLARPFRLFHPPLPLRCELPRAEVGKPIGARRSRHREPDGPPALLQLAEVQSVCSPPKRVIAFWGPERIETGWWRGLTICRDYWRVETETNQHFWVYRDLRSGEWFLHGEF